jgi:hypothetical protein
MSTEQDRSWLCIVKRIDVDGSSVFVNGGSGANQDADSLDWSISLPNVAFSGCYNNGNICWTNFVDYG